VTAAFDQPYGALQRWRERLTLCLQYPNLLLVPRGMSCEAVLCAIRICLRETKRCESALDALQTVSEILGWQTGLVDERRTHLPRAMRLVRGWLREEIEREVAS